MLRHRLEQLKKCQNQGLSLPFVACAGALLLAFALAMVYTAGVMLSNASHKLGEERCYQLAKSFSGVVGQELTDPEGSFYQFANKFLDNASYSNYLPDHPETVYHYILKTPEDKDYGQISLLLYKETNEAGEAGLEGTIEIPGSNVDQNYTSRINDLNNKKFQRYFLTVEVVAEQDGLAYHYATEYYREDQYQLVFKYNEQVIVWDADVNKWKYDNTQGAECQFHTESTEDAEITFTYDTSQIRNTRYAPVHEEGGASS